MEFMDALEARWACKLYDASKPVSEEDELAILEAARLAPSSFGLEPWRFVAVRDDTLRFKLFGACFLQDSVRTAPLVIVSLVRAARFYAPDSDFVKARSARFPGGYPVFLEDYRGYYAYLHGNGLLEHWARAQSYIACANMMNAATDRGLASCAIEGYDEAQALAILAEALPGFDSADWRVGLLCSVGLPGEPRRERVRASLEELLTRL
jgi:nitroreductase